MASIIDWPTKYPLEDRPTNHWHAQKAAYRIGGFLLLWGETLRKQHAYTCNALAVVATKKWKDLFQIDENNLKLTPKLTGATAK